jgi:hypothetical protein
MNASTAPAARKKQRHPLLKLIFFALAVVIAIVAVTGNNKKTPGSTSSPSTPATTSAAFTPTYAGLTAAVTSAVNGDSDSPGVASVQSAQCINEDSGNSMSGTAGLNCFATYTVKTPPGISAALELIDPTRGIFQSAFTDPKVQAVYVEVRGPVTSVGGKSSTSDMFSLACTKSASNQISWTNVGVSGLKQLCTYNAQVGGLNN